MRWIDDNGVTHIEGRSPPRGTEAEEVEASNDCLLDVRKPASVTAGLAGATVCALITLLLNPVVSLGISLCMLLAILFAPWVESEGDVGGRNTAGFVVRAVTFFAAIVAYSAAHAESQMLLAVVSLGLSACAAFSHIQRFAPSRSRP